MNDIETILREIEQDFGNHKERLRKLLIGKQAVIVRDFHDQPYGSSKPNLKGQTVTVESVCVDPNSLSGTSLHVFAKGYRCGIPLNFFKLKQNNQ